MNGVHCALSTHAWDTTFMWELLQKAKSHRKTVVGDTAKPIVPNTVSLWVTLLPQKAFLQTCSAFLPAHYCNCKSSRDNRRTTHFKGSGDSFVPERLICIKARELLKNCLKDRGTSFPFLGKKTKKKITQASNKWLSSICPAYWVCRREIYKVTSPIDL